MLEALIAKKAFDLAFDKAKSFLAGRDVELTCTRTDLDAAFALQQQGVQRWSDEISFKDLRGARATAQVYVDLGVYVLPRATRLEAEEVIESRRLDDVVANLAGHVVLLGQPGAGKSTSMKYICHRLLVDENFLSGVATFPIVIRLRDLNQSSGRVSLDAFSTDVIFPALAKQLGLVFKTRRGSASEEAKEENVGLAEAAVLLFLEELGPTIILDGFDEISTRERREVALHVVRSLMRQLDRAHILMTSRTGEFPYQIENASCYEICPLDDSQIVEFAQKWLSNDTSASKFVNEVRQSPFADTTIKPLTLAHLCAIYERLGRIPEKPKTVYKKVVNLLIEEWDEQRSVSRTSRYSEFSPDRKFDFLCRLAFELTIYSEGTVFGFDQLQVIYKKVCRDFDLRISESRKVLAELESHTGLFVQAGYRTYEFAHRSLQEYLSAEYIKGLPSLLSGKNMIAQLPNEFAIATAISTNPSRYLVELVVTRLCSAHLTLPFYTTFLSRLIQEKPEFNSDDEVILSLLVLYSTYLNRASTKGSQLSLFIFDELAGQFESLMTAVAKRNRRRVIDEYYEVHGETHSVDGSLITVLRRIKKIKQFVLPDELLARQQFLESKAA